MQKSKGSVAEKGVGLKKTKFVRREFTHTVRHCPRALFPTGMGVMVHTARGEAGRRRGGQRKCTIQITIKVQLYIPRGTWHSLQEPVCLGAFGGADKVVPFSQLFSYRGDINKK